MFDNYLAIRLIILPMHQPAPCFSIFTESLPAWGVDVVDSLGQMFVSVSCGGRPFPQLMQCLLDLPTDEGLDVSLGSDVLARSIAFAIAITSLLLISEASADKGSRFPMPQQGGPNQAIDLRHCF